MARPNQGIYKQYRNQSNEILNETTKLISRYWDIDDCYCYGRDEANDYFWTANSLYKQSNEMINKWNNLMESQKFEERKKIIEYKEIISNLEDCLYQLQSKAKELHYNLGPDYSDLEITTFKQYDILR